MVVTPPAMVTSTTMVRVPTVAKKWAAMCIVDAVLEMERRSITVKSSVLIIQAPATATTMPIPITTPTVVRRVGTGFSVATVICIVTEAPQRAAPMDITANTVAM